MMLRKARGRMGVMASDICSVVCAGGRRQDRESTCCVVCGSCVERWSREGLRERDETWMQAR